MKVRIFSPCGKASPGSHADFKNPVVGKGQALSRKLPWLPPNWRHLEKSLIQRWCSRMDQYISLREPYWYLPIKFGGGGIPCPFSNDWVVLETLRKSWKYFLAVRSVLDGEAPFWLRQALSAMSRGNVARGSEYSLRQAAHEAYVMSCEVAGYRLHQDNVAELCGMSPKEFNNLPRSKRRKKGKEHGYITEFDLDTRIEKAWLVKSAFQAAFRGDEVTLRMRDPPELLWDQFNDLVNSSESRVLKYSSPEAIALRFRDFLDAAERPKEIQHYFIKEEVLSRNFGALRTPMPGTFKDLALVRGSTADILD